MLPPQYAVIDARDVTVECEILSDIADVQFYDAKKPEDIPDSVEDVDAIAVWHTIWLTEELLGKFKKARVIVRMGVGYDNVDIQVTALATGRWPLTADR